jgi:hypothetical protein
MFAMHGTLDMHSTFSFTGLVLPATSDHLCTVLSVANCLLTGVQGTFVESRSAAWDFSRVAAETPTELRKPEVLSHHHNLHLRLSLG